MQTTTEIVSDLSTVDGEDPAAGGSQTAPDHPTDRWAPARSYGFRMIFVYIMLFIFPFPLTHVPGLATLIGYYEKLWNTLVPWVGTHVFGVAVTVRPNGSGDTTYNYIQVFCFLIAAIAVAAVWTIIDRRPRHDARLYRILRVLVRYYLASVMIQYGVIKVIQSQFPSPTLDRLLQPFGDASPMGILWTFMGVSQGYNIFTGAGELLGGLLLTARRTTLLGALVSFGVLSHVAALNFFYDVPVKLFSMHLLALAVFLIAPDFGRLMRLLVTNRAVLPVAITPLLGSKSLDRSAVVVRTILVLLYVSLGLLGAAESRKVYGDGAPRSPFRGIWNVDELKVDGMPRPPLVTDGDRWRRVVFDHPKMVAIQLMSDNRRRYMLELDEAKKVMVLTRRDDPAWKSTLAYEQPDPNVLTVSGAYDGHEIRAVLKRSQAPEFLLLSRGFHWINEYPFNR